MAGQDELTLREVQAALDHFIRAFTHLDWDAFRQCFAPDAGVFHPDNPETPGLGRLDGQAVVEASFRPVFEGARRAAAGPPYLYIEPQRVRIQLLHEAAVVSFEFARPGGSLGRRTLVFERRGDGWKIMHLHASNMGAG